MTVAGWCDYRMDRDGGRFPIESFDAWKPFCLMLVSVLDAELVVENDLFPPELRFGIPEEP